MGYIRYICALALIIVITLCHAGTVFADDEKAASSERIIVREDIPSLGTIKRVSGAHTHSGFDVPRYVSLKFGTVNGRQGPSLKHSALWQYQREGLPLVVVAEMDIWRKVRDMHGDESWVRTQALSGKRMAITLDNTAVRNKPKQEARIRAAAPSNTLLELFECNDADWCLVKSRDGYKGWVKRDSLWGAEPL